MTRRTLALVESATQLLNVAEWAYATGDAADMSVAILAPKDPHTVRQIESVRELVQDVGLEIRRFQVRDRSPRIVAELGRVTLATARAEQLILGDPFSRLVQTLLPTFRARSVIVVDDGTATWEFARCIDQGKPLIRWGAPLTGDDRRASRATASLAPSVGRDLTVFSCLSDAAPLAATVLANRYEWTRASGRPEVHDDGIDLLGVSLVDNGIVRRRPYVAAVARLARREGKVRYIAHRRESASLVGEIAALPGVRVVRSHLPVEIGLRRGPVARRIVAFPSTAAHTLPVVLNDVGVRLDVAPIEPEWFTASTSRHAREFVARIAGQTPSARRGVVIGR